jgi:hypothetical protein
MKHVGHAANIIKLISENDSKTCGDAMLGCFHLTGNYGE